jgi:hypothetical protein
MQVSFMIPTFQNPEGLYLTLFAALEQLEKSDLEWEIVVCADGGTPSKFERAHPNIKCLRYGGGNRLGSPQATRDAGIRGCQYRNVLCVDSHVIVSDIQKWVSEHERLNAAISFPAMVGVSSEMFKIYGNQMAFDTCFWNVMTYSQPKSWEPFQVCQCAHSGFMISRDWYMAGNGYTLEQRGYGAEEPWLSLWAWMMGGAVWMIPSVFHAHYMPTGRNDGAGQTEDFARNFMLCSYVMGGQEYLNKTQSYFSWAKSLVINPEIQRLRDKICSGPFRGDLNALRAYFKREGVVGGCD